MREIIASCKTQTPVAEKLKKWVIYWKKRGKARNSNHQEH